MDLLYKQQGHEPLRPAAHLIRCALRFRQSLPTGRYMQVYSPGIHQGRGVCGHPRRTDVPLTSCMQVIEVVRKVSPKIKAPIIMFTYFNPIMRRGCEVFCRQIKEAGALGTPLAS